MEQNNFFAYLSSYFGSIVGLIAAIVISGPLARSILNRAKDEIPREIDLPDPEAKKAWETLTRFAPIQSPRILGAIECLIFFLALYTQAYILAAGWLAFKVASAWPVWQHFMRLPERLDAVRNEVEYLGVRNAWGTRLLTVFLLGTATNILAAFAGIVLSRLVDDIFYYR